MIPVTRTDITPSTGSYLDVDVTAYVDAGNTAGVMLEIINTNAGATYAWGARKNGGSDTHEGDLYKGAHTWVAIGIDASDIFEAYVENAAIKIYIVGYITNAEGGFLTNAVDKTPARDATWNDMDISGQTGGDTAICAFFVLTGSLGYNYGLRKNGSTDNRAIYPYLAGVCQGAMMSVDGSEILEGYVAGGTAITFYLVGWLTANMLDWANAKDYSTGTINSWVETDMSSDIAAGYDGAFGHFFPTSADHLYGGIRKLGSAFDDYAHLAFHAYLWVEVDGDRKVEQKIESTAVDLFLWGYTQQPAEAGIEVNVNDAISVTDISIDTLVDYTRHISKFETVGVAEALTMFTNKYYLSVYDTASVVDVPSFLTGDITIDVYDTVGITEDIISKIIFNINVFDLATLAEYIDTSKLAIGINVNDTVSVAEFIKNVLLSNINVNDATSLAEAITSVASLYNISITETLSVSDKAYLDFWIQRIQETDTWTKRTKETDAWTQRTKETDTWTKVVNKET